MGMIQMCEQCHRASADTEVEKRKLCAPCARSYRAARGFAYEPAGAYPARRACNGCTLCCTELRIPAPIDSPKGEHCKHECAKGCAIYDTRPDVCLGFTCLWLAEGAQPPSYKPVLREEDWPKNVGIFFTPNGPTRVAGEKVVWLACYGDTKTKQARTLLNRLAKRQYILLIRERRIIGPDPAKVERITKAAEIDNIPISDPRYDTAKLPEEKGP